MLASLGIAEAGAVIGGGVANGFDSSAAGVPLIALGDLWTLSVIDVALEEQRAARLSYVPQETASGEFFGSATNAKASMRKSYQKWIATDGARLYPLQR